MVRETTNHGWQVHESGEENYADTFDDLIDNIDSNVIKRGPIDNRPQAGNQGHIYLSTDEDPPILYFDTGSSWEGIKGEIIVPDNVAEVDAEETITSKWTFNESIDGDIDGRAEYANTAGLAELADSAQTLGGRSASAFAKSEENENIPGQWTFENEITFAGGIEIGETIDLPVYNGQDPDNPAPGAMWFREDHQPTS